MNKALQRQVRQEALVRVQLLVQVINHSLDTMRDQLDDPVLEKRVETIKNLVCSISDGAWSSARRGGKFL